MSDVFDLVQGKAARDKGMERVLAHEETFAYRFHQVILHLPHGWVGQCEDIRRNWVGKHPHPNAWGSAWGVAFRRGLLRKLPIEAHMTARRSHGRRTHLYQRV
jgi:hypothetical protein